MDDHNVHHFWGISPAVDLLHVLCHDKQHPLQEDVHILQVSPYDFRHTLETVSKARRHTAVSGRHVHLYVYEDHAEGLARHLLLLAALLDEQLPARERMELVLELHGNALLREKSADCLDALARQLEQMVACGSAKQAAVPSAAASGSQALAQLVDLSLLRYQERDELADVLRKYRKNATYDMVKAWDTRCRRWYGDRFDVRRNVIDWDYQMRIAQLGTPGQPTELGSIVHFQHFREWRLHGVAYELRDCVYSHPNRSLLSTALGRTKEFKDRSGRDVGRSIAAWGYWGDVLNAPYAALGLATEEAAFYRAANKQFTRTAVDVAQHNVTALLHELRTGARCQLSQGSEASRAAAARGPISLEQLEAEQEASSSAADQREKREQEPISTAAATATEMLAGCATTDNAAAARSTCSEQASMSAATKDDVTASGCCNTTSSSSSSSSGGGGGAMHEPAEQLRAAEVRLDAAGWHHLQQFTLHLLTGDLVKALSGRTKFAGRFDGVSVGHRHSHLLGPEHRLAAVLKPGTRVVVESAKYLLQLTEDQAGKFAGKVVELAGASGLQTVQSPQGVDEAHMVFASSGAAAGV